MVVVLRDMNLRSRSELPHHAHGCNFAGSLLDEIEYRQYDHRQRKDDAYNHK
jgi:hypothetical protein